MLLCDTQAMRVANRGRAVVGVVVVAVSLLAPLARAGVAEPRPAAPGLRWP